MQSPRLLLLNHMHRSEQPVEARPGTVEADQAAPRCSAVSGATGRFSQNQGGSEDPA